MVSFANIHTGKTRTKTLTTRQLQLTALIKPNWRQTFNNFQEIATFESFETLCPNNKFIIGLTFQLIEKC